MMQFSSDPRTAEQEMHAVIYYLTAFGYVDGHFDASERAYVKDYIGQLVAARARGAMGDDDPAYADVVGRWTEHFHEVFEQIDHSIHDWYTESVGDGETSEQFVIAKLKLRCFELFKAFDEATRAQLLGVVDELMHADGIIHPNEQQFRNELYRLLFAPVEIPEADIETVPEGGVLIDEMRPKPLRELDHAFFKRSEWDYDKDPERFIAQTKADIDLIRRYREELERQRAWGRGKLLGTPDFEVFAGEEPFLDGHVHVFPPKKDAAYELLVLGDLHGCYSCLKGALLQADFFAKAQAYHDDPVNNPRMLAVFLGDYIDRGKFSYNGILRTVLELYLAVPESVFVLRGNHEYYVELNGRVLAPVRPAEAMESLKHIATNEVFAEYMRLFEAMPNMLVFDRTLFVHAGIPREDTIAEKVHGPADLNDPDVRFQMLWSDPSESDAVPLELQKANARFPFGRKQFKSFMSRLGLTTMIRGHERVVEGFKTVYDDPEATLLSLFSAGGKDNADLPEKSNYREVRPMALTIRHAQGVTTLSPFEIEFSRFNDPQYNAFFRDQLGAGR